MKKNYSIRKITIFSLIFALAFSSNVFAAVPLPKGVGLPGGTLTDVISNFTNWILGIFGFLAIISFVVSGIMYFLAAGDDKSQEKAKKQMQWSILGVVIGLVGLVVVYAVDMLLRATS